MFIKLKYNHEKVYCIQRNSDLEINFFPRLNLFCPILLIFSQARAKKESLAYEFLTGKRQNWKLLYVRKYKCLYVKKNRLKKATDYICYQTILRKHSKKSTKKKVPACSSRVKIDNRGVCTRKRISHSKHTNHKQLYKDIKTRSNFLDDVVAITKLLEGLSTDVSNSDIFTRELAK